MPDVHEFQGEYRFLSNFWRAQIRMRGVIYPSTEHAFQAAKTLDMDERAKIAKLSSAREAKHAGYKVKLRDDWEQIRLDVMEALVRFKFTNHPHLRDRLLATGDGTLAEGNYWHDNFWGICGCSECHYKEGRNHLGEILMKVRGQLK